MFKDRLKSKSRDVFMRSESGSRESSDMNVENMVQRRLTQYLNIM